MGALLVLWRSVEKKEEEEPQEEEEEVEREGEVKLQEFKRREAEREEVEEEEEEREDVKEPPRGGTRSVFVDNFPTAHRIFDEGGGCVCMWSAHTVKVLSGGRKK